MTSKRSNAGTPKPAPNFAHGALVALGLVLGITAAHADVALYQASVPLKGASSADRTAGFGEALKVAAIRATGRRDAATSPRITSAASDPTPYVQQYSTTSDRMLKVGFDARAVEQLLQQAGLPLWPSERPVTTVLLFTPAVAGGARAVTTADRPPERVEIERAAQVRGVPLAWPSENIDSATARARASSPGAGSAVLFGLSAGGAIDWSFAHAGQVARGQGSPADGADLAADSLAARYAPASTKGSSAVSVRIAGLDDVRSYAALMEYLEGLSLVRSVAVREFAGDSVRLDLTVRGDRELLARIFALDARIFPAPGGESAATDAPDFLWRP